MSFFLSPDFVYRLAISRLLVYIFLRLFGPLCGTFFLFLFQHLEGVLSTAFGVFSSVTVSYSTVFLCVYELTEILLSFFLSGA